ncbi:LamG domain-containing protein [Henriciella mobilis]|uniref:3-keto-disaccharide hydrolase domain-containing protein n=1 Tax=Henriciella mobilis TaxID=2305467 RepID=A0A399RRS0_9PROT|nr:hypothetical protein [Henriciella mobilis]RIJ32597.1 hypothetical protein D1223_01725 [Henriciella mobilis]
MHILTRTILTITALSLLQGAAMSQEASTLSFAGHDWRVTAQAAEVTTHDGRDALALTGGRVWTDDLTFTDGVISFDVAYQEETIFVGASWRTDAAGEFMEDVYFRGHLNEKPDAMQYTPEVNGLSAWQIFSDDNAGGPVSQQFGAWNTVRIVVEGDMADIYFNSDTPVLHVPDLKTDRDAGGIALRSTGVNSGTAYYSNLVVRPLAAGEGVTGTPKADAKPPAGAIESWQVSSTAIDEALVAGATELPTELIKDLGFAAVATETNGIANLARVTGPASGADTLLVRLKLTSDTDQMKQLVFGYSDRVRLYLNGKLVYGGDASWKARDYRFLGTVGFFDAVGLDLKAGENELIAAVSETFGGWAWAGAMADRDGVKLD